MKRTKSSVRFNPYYKVQWHDPISLTWRDIQQTYETLEQAQASYPLEKRCRVMEITMKGRRPLG